MATVGVRELRQNLSVYLDRVKKGEALTVTEHGKVVAMLRPPDATGSLAERLVAEGRARRATRAIHALPRPLRLMRTRPLSESIADDREDRL
jgi:prevent-host-death family protein